MDVDKHGAIATLLQPLDVDHFISAYWEKSPVQIERTDPDHFAHILSIESVDALLSSSELYFPDVQLIQQPDGIAKDQYVDKHNQVLPLRLIEYYAAGATVTIAKADTKIASLGDFCRQLQTEWCMQCHANVYLSPPGQQGFNPHYDTHDVFIVQASGKKQFNFYSNNTELPFNEDDFDSQIFFAGDKTEEIILSAGDTLYIPRGITHDAIALDHHPSLHITVGVYPVVARDLIQELVQIAAEQDVGFRQSVPLKHLTSSTQHQNTMELLTSLLDQLVTPENVNIALARYTDQIALQCMQNSSGLLSRQFRLSPITADSVVTVRPGQVISIDTSNGSADMQRSITTLRLPGQIVEFNHPMGAAVHWLIEKQVTTVSQLPGLDDKQKIALIDKLRSQNIVTVD